MPTKAGQIVIDITSGTANFVQDLEKAKGSVREFGQVAGGSMRTAAAETNILRTGVLANTRAVDQFLISTLKLGPIMQAAFPLFGLAAFGAMLFDTGKKVYDFFKTMQDAPDKIAAAFRGLSEPLRITDDELRVSNARLESEIAKLEGKPRNGLKIALEEAALAADKLGDSLEQAFAKARKTLEENKPNFAAAFSLSHVSGLPDLDDYLKKQQAAVDKINTIKEQRIDDIRNDPKLSEKQKLDQTEMVARDTADDELAIYKKVGEWLQVQKTEADKKLAAAHTGEVFYKQGLAAYSASAQGLINQNTRQSIVAKDQIQNTSLTERKTELIPEAEAALAAKKQLDEWNAEAARRQHEQATKEEEDTKHLQALNAQAQADKLGGLEKIAVEERQMYRVELEKQRANDGFVGPRLPIAPDATTADMAGSLTTQKAALIAGLFNDKRSEAVKKYAAEVTKLFDKFREEDLKDAEKHLEEYSKAVGKLAAEINKVNKEQAEQNVKHAVTMAGINGNSKDPVGTLANQQAIEKLAIEQQYVQALAFAKQTEQGLVLLETESLLIKQKTLELTRLQQQMEETIAANRQKGVADFFKDMETKAQTAGNILYESMTSALDKVSDQLAKLFTGQKTSFGEMFKSLGESMVKASVKSALQQGLGALGKKLGIHLPGGKPDGTAGNPLHVLVDNPAGGSSTNPYGSSSQPNSTPIPNGTAGLFSTIGGLLGGSGGSGASSAAGAAGDGLSPSVTSSISYGGGMAEGGSVDPGHAYDVNDSKEPEYFVPKTAGTITPMHKMGGTTITNNIDARGAALGVENRVARSIELSHQSSIQHSVRATEERKARTPQRKG